MNLQEKSTLTEAAIQNVHDERLRQNAKWGEQNHSLPEFIAILAEETGEAAKEAIDYHFRHPVKKDGAHVEASAADQMERISNLRNELIQVAAVAVQIVEFIDRGMEPSEDPDGDTFIRFGGMIKEKSPVSSSNISHPSPEDLSLMGIKAMATNKGVAYAKSRVRKIFQDITPGWVEAVRKYWRNK